MIRPEDLFDSHRVVRSPGSYRRISAPASLGIVRGFDAPTLTDATRRATLGRVIRRRAGDLVATARLTGAGKAVADRWTKLGPR